MSAVQEANISQPDSLPKGFTCLSCRVLFKTAEDQRLHFRSDWHRYNLKRKMSGLPSVAAQDFQEKILNQRNIEPVDKSVYCQICQKVFGNENSYNNHLNSKKHKENLKLGSESKDTEDIEEDLEEEEVDSDEWDADTVNPIETNSCIFCLQQNKSYLKNLEHMTTSHSFFIPDIEYCTDVYGLLKYLGEKISEGYMCLWCNESGRSFHSADAARQHMIDKGHCKMVFEGPSLAEYFDFYDYSSSYPDAEESKDPDEEISPEQLDDSDFQLVLPSGAVVGHRSLMRYYKQNINHTAVVPVASKKTVPHSYYKSLGWTESDKAKMQRAKDFVYMKKMQNKLMLKLGLRGNKLQKHVRPQVNF